MKGTILVSDIEIGRLKKLAEHLKKRTLLERVDRESAKPKLRVYENGSAIRYLDFPFAECTHIFDEWGFNTDGQPTLRIPALTVGGEVPPSSYWKDLLFQGKWTAPHQLEGFPGSIMTG